MTSIADVSTGVVRAVIEIDALPEVVFAALTEPQQLAAWWGGDQYETFDWEIDLRIGGRWSAKIRGPTGPESVHGEYLEVHSPDRLVCTWHASWDGFARTVLRYELTKTTTGTRVSVVHDGFAGRPASCEGHAEGWQSVLEWLAGHSRDCCVT